MFATSECSLLNPSFQLKLRVEIRLMRQTDAGHRNKWHSKWLLSLSVPLKGLVPAPNNRHSRFFGWSPSIRLQAGQTQIGWPDQATVHGAVSRAQ